jgi:type IV pilus assembly protein PilF
MIKRKVLCAAVTLLMCLTIGCANNELRKEQAQLHMQIGTGYLNQGKNPQALIELLKAEELDPEDASIQNSLGLAYYFRKEYPLSETHFLKAIKFFPKYTDARNNLGRLYTDLGRFDEAIGQLKFASRDLTYTLPERIFLNLGIVYLRKNDFDRALNNFKKSMESNTRFCPAYNYYGQTLFQQAKYSEAIESFDHALALCNNNYDEAHYYSAISYYKAGQTEKAIARLEEVEKRYPDSEYARKAKEMIKTIQ